MYEFAASVLSPFCDAQYYFSPEYAMHMVQETAGRMASVKNCGIPVLLKESKSWVIVSASIDIFSKPYWMTDLALEGYYFQPSAGLVPRRVWCRTPDGEYAFKADSLWGVVSVDENGRHKLIDPRIVTDRFDYDRNIPGDALAQRYRKFDINSFGKEAHSVVHKVIRKDCDINCHANNLKYVEWIVNYIPDDAYADDRDIRKIDICYINELHYGDVVELKYVSDQDGSYYVSVGGAAFAHLIFDRIPRVRF